MKKKNAKLTWATLIVLQFVFFISCKEYDPGASKTVELAGEFYVRFYADSISDASLIEDYSLLQVHNTAADTEDKMWLTHDKLKVLLNVSIEDLSYSASNYRDVTQRKKDSHGNWGNESDTTLITTLSGRLIKNASTLPSKVTMDSLYITFKTDKDPENDPTYIIAGSRRSGFLEDEH